MEMALITLAAAVSLAVGLAARELVKAWVALRQGDLTGKLHGRLGLAPRVVRSAADPFGTMILPILGLILVLAGKMYFPLFAYVKPLPITPGNFKDPKRGTVVVALAGPVTNLVLAAIAGLALRLGLGQEYVGVFLQVNLGLALINLLPIPGFDGSLLLALVMPPRARDVYEGLDQYLILFVLGIFFVLGQTVFAIVFSLSGVLCNLLAGPGFC